LQTGVRNADVQKHVKITVLDPDEKQLEVSIENTSNSGEYKLTYRPKSMGAHTISVLVYGVNIAGSPFITKVCVSLLMELI
jgi:hypothetical protein